MTERDRRSEFLNFMRLPDGTPLATVEVLDYLTINRERGSLHDIREQ